MWRSESVDIVYDWCPPMTAIHEKDKKKKEFFHLLMLTYDYTEIPRIRRSVNGEIFHTWVPTYYYNSWEGWREVRVGKSFLHGCPPITTIPEKDVENWELGNLSYMGAHCPPITIIPEKDVEKRERGEIFLTGRFVVVWFYICFYRSSMHFSAKAAAHWERNFS